MTYRVGISGSYGGLNLGDEAILGAMLARLRRSLSVEVTVFSRDSTDTLRRHGVERAVPARRLTRAEARAEIEGLDVFVLGGGGILYDREAPLFMREVFLAHELGVPVMVYAVSAGPLRDRSVRGLVAAGLNRAAVITVRDRPGRRVLEEIGVEREIEVTADPALLLEGEPVSPEDLAREGLDLARRRVGFSVREPGPAAPDIDVDHYHRLLANAADFIVDRFDADAVFVPMERRHMDLQHSHAVIARMECAQRASVLRGEYTPGQVLALSSRFDFAVGMRLHFLIFAAMQGVPFVALPYASKVVGLIESLEMEMPALHRVHTGRLLAAIDRSWDLREPLRARIRARLPGLRALARRNNELLVQLLTEKTAARRGDVR